MNSIERNNVKIIGRGGKPIMFSHGYGCDQSIWRLVAPAFEDDHRVILFDHVGSGGSNIAKYDRCKYSSLHGYADDIVEIGHDLDLKGAIFVGHSVSSVMGILAAIKDPNLFDELILIGPSPCYINDGDYIGGFSADDIKQMMELVESNYEGWARTMAPVIMGGNNPPELTMELLENFCRTKPEIAQHFAAVTFLSDNRKDLPQLSKPSLILQCRHDSIAPVSVGKYLNTQLKQSKLKIIDVSGHCPHLSAPNVITESIRNYLNHASGASRARDRIFHEPVLGDQPRDQGHDEPVDYRTQFGQQGSISIE